MSDTFDYLNGEVSENTSYTPVPVGRYKAVVVKAEMTDPLALGWKIRDDATEAEKEDMSRPFPRLRWQIESLENGDETEYAGRTVDQRLDLRSGVNPKTGRSFAEGRSDLLRAANGLKATDEVVGLKLIQTDLRGMDRDEAVAAANEDLKRYEGVKATVRIIHITNKQTGEARDSIGKIVLPK